MLEFQNFRGLDERIKVDTSEEQPVYLLVGKNGSHIRLSPSAYYLLHSVYKGFSFEKLAEQLSQRQGRIIAPSEVEKAYRSVTERIVAIEERTGTNVFGFWLRVKLVPAWLVVKISQPLSIAFHPLVASFLLGVIIVTTIWMMQWGLSFTLSPESFWIGYALFLVSLIFHELGHASACVRYGVRPSDIGFAIYWIYPAFYSDVSPAWQLKRWQRVIVDLGGAFFQFVVGACYILIYVFSGWQPVQVAFSMILYSTLFILNPVLKFDGYWVIADALGVTNLAAQPRRVLRYLVDRLHRRPTQLLPWPLWIAVTMIVYTLISFSFWGYFIWVLIPFVWNTASTYPFVVITLIDSLSNSSSTVLLSSFQSFLMATFSMVIVVLMLQRLATLVLRTISSLVLRSLRVSSS
jgi:putative peptide zinc metalloprotease protein